MTSTPVSRRDLWYRRAAVLGAMAVTAAGIGLRGGSVFAAKPISHGAAGPSCAVSGTTVNAPLSVTGAGYQPGSSYRVEFTWPSGAGVADTAAWADGSGNIAVSSSAYWSGTYQVGIYATTGSRALLASCSTTIN